jgi:hypothetical protein
LKSILIPDTQQSLWVIVAQQPCKATPLVLLANVPLHAFDQVSSVYNDWRLRSRIEHGYRFDQEQGLEVEDIRVHKLERMKRLFLLTLTTAQFVFYLIDTWPPPATTVGHKPDDVSIVRGREAHLDPLAERATTAVWRV